METWKILIISLLAAVAAGSIGGLLIGKYLVKREKSDRKPLLSKKERIVYSACIMLGLSFILFGVFYKPAAEANPPAIMFGDGVTDAGIAGGADAQNGVVVAQSMSKRAAPRANPRAY